MQVRKSPHRQVRNHARRLRELLNSRVQDPVNWIDTCAFYSYPGAQVNRLGRAENKTIASNESELKSFLAGIDLSGPRSIDVDQIVQALKGETGDIAGLGRWRATWPSSLS